MKQKANFLIFCMIFVVRAAFCQQISQFANTIPLHSTPPYIITIKPVDPENRLSCWGTKFQKYYRKNIKDSACDNKATPAISLLPANYYSANLGFFCKQEIKFEKTTKVPFKFRLGTVQQCDWMEAKPNTTFNKQ